MKTGKLVTLLALVWSFSAHGADELIPHDVSFGDESKKTETKHTIPSGEKITYQEEGKKYGMKYRFFSDGSGSIAGDEENDISYSRRYTKGNWSVRCKRDVMNDSVLCSASREDVNFLIYYSNATEFIIGLLGNHYPGSKIFIRIDEGKVFSAEENIGFDKQQSAEILKLIKDGSKVATRYVDWPRKLNIDNSADVYGLMAVMDYLRWVVKVAN